MTKLKNPAIRKGIFAIAAVALVSTTGGVAWAQANRSMTINPGALLGLDNRHGNNNGNNNGYGNNNQRQKAIKRLNAAVARANSNFTHDVSHSLFQVAKQYRNNAGKLQVIASASSQYYSTVSAAQSRFAAAVNAAATSTTTDGAFNTAYDAAQNQYLAALTSANATLVNTLSAANINTRSLSGDIGSARDRLARNLDKAQSHFVKQTKEKKKSGFSTRSLEADDNSEVELEGAAYPANAPQYKPGQKIED